LQRVVGDADDLVELVTSGWRLLAVLEKPPGNGADDREALARLRLILTVLQCLVFAGAPSGERVTVFDENQLEANMRRAVEAALLVVVSLSDLARRWGVTPAWVTRLSQASFPSPVGEVHGRRVWWGHEVERWWQARPVRHSARSARSSTPTDG
jgi:hypothetical protein